MDIEQAIAHKVAVGSDPTRADGQNPLTRGRNERLKTTVETQFAEIEYESELYEQELVLRNALLRRPLGLAITNADIQEDATQSHFGMLHDGQLVACVVVVDLGDQRAKIRQMVVAEDHQRRGVGSKLMQQTEACLREREFLAVELNARVEAIDFYERLGYRPIGNRFTEVTIEHQKMERTL